MNDIDERLGGIKTKLSDEVVKYAKRIGMSGEMIATFDSDEALRNTCNRIKPGLSTVTSNVPKKSIAKKIIEKIKGKVGTSQFTTKLPVSRALHLRRSDFDEQQLRGFLNRNRIREDSIKKITLIRNCVADKEDRLSTTIIIEHIKPEK